MSKIITAYFLDDDGSPATGLTPTIRIRDLSDNTLVITDAAMSEVGDGGYKYDFIDYDLSAAYQIRCDAGASITNRWAFGYNKSSYYAGLSIVSAYFINDNYIPATGLLPTIRIRDLSDNSLVVTDVVMTEVGDGGYKYIFSSYNDIKNYQIRCDAGSGLVARYSFGFNGEYTVEVMTLPMEGDIMDTIKLSGDIENIVSLTGDIVVK